MKLLVMDVLPGADDDDGPGMMRFLATDVFEVDVKARQDGR